MMMVYIDLIYNKKTDEFDMKSNLTGEYLTKLVQDFNFHLGEKDLKRGEKTGSDTVRIFLTFDPDKPEYTGMDNCKNGAERYHVLTLWLWGTING